LVISPARPSANPLQKRTRSDDASNIAIDVSWKGKMELAVATRDGVKQPLNRRAIIKVTPAN